MVFVTLSETYDLHTKVGKMSLIGIHTPTVDIIQKTYPGLCMNSKYVRIVKQDVVLACASMLPADPSQVGFEDGDIAPQDMFNPILYKAVSNDSFSTLEARIQGLYNSQSASWVTPSLEGPSVVAENENTTGLSDDFGVYYALLSNHEGFKKAHPQQGLQLKGLKPLVFERYYTVGANNGAVSNDTFTDIEMDTNHNLAFINRNARSFRGNAHPMPKFNTTYITSVTGTGAGSNGNGMGDYKPTNTQINMPAVPPVMTACICMPPARMTSIYYRMTVRTTVEFTDVRPIQEITSFAQMSTEYAPIVYHSDYVEQAKMMTMHTGMVDVKDAEIEKIMEGA